MSSPAGKPQEDWRVRAEAKRKAALEIRARNDAKRLKEADAKPAASAVAVTPATKQELPCGSVANPYAKKSPPKASNPYGKKSPAKSPASAAAAVTPKPPAGPKEPSFISQAAASAAETAKAIVSSPAPQVTSAWGDCRLDLWEATCRCGGERKSPDVRMCRCPAAYDAGLGCDGCNRGVLLIKSGPRGYFWGCSNYKKGGCKHTKRFGPPYDRDAARELARIKHGSATARMREMAERSRIADPFEVEWRDSCRCDGARDLDTFECFMRSEGGCGMLPACPEHCGGMLFLHSSRYGGGKRWWGCSNHKNGVCKFRRDYVEHTG